MVVSFSIGSKSKAVINRLSKTADNVDFYTYITMQELIREATLRHISFDRIVFSSEILNKNDPESDLRALNDFIQNFSNQTELVFIIKGTEDVSNLENLFNNMFNSPLYTPVIMKTANSKVLLELIKEDIVQLKTRYYTLADKEDRVLVSGGTGVKQEEPVQQEKSTREGTTEKKKGIFGGFFNRQSKKSGVSHEMENPVKEELNIPTEVEKNSTENSSAFSSGPSSIAVGSSIQNGGKDQVVNSNESNNFSSKEIVSPVIEPEISTEDFGNSNNEDELLSLGDFGEKHSDTGFLDEDDEEELKKFAESQEKEELIDESVVNWDTLEENIIEEAKKEVIEKPVIKKSTDDNTIKRVGKTHIDLVTGVKGSGVTQEIVDEAVRLAEKENKKVLIVDLDYKENELLSYIDTERFYIEGANNGLEKIRVYSEDGVDIISNGYGELVNTRMLGNLLSGNLIKRYDMVFIDCPTDCLRVFNIDLISMCNILVIVSNTTTDLISTSKELTDRGNVDYDVERYIAENCDVEVVNGKLSNTDLAFVKRVCLFANGNWLLRVES